MKFTLFQSTRSCPTPLLGMSMFICFSVFITPCSAATGDVRLAPGVPLVVLPGTPSPVKKAVADLQRDLEKVLGQPSPVVESTKDLHGRPAILIAVDGSLQPARHEAAVAGREAHGIHLREIDGQNCVVLEGADPSSVVKRVRAISFSGG